MGIALISCESVSSLSCHCLEKSLPLLPLASESEITILGRVLLGVSAQCTGGYPRPELEQYSTIHQEFPKPILLALTGSAWEGLTNSALQGDVSVSEAPDVVTAHWEGQKAGNAVLKHWDLGHTSHPIRGWPGAHQGRTPRPYLLKTMLI